MRGRTRYENGVKRKRKPFWGVVVRCSIIHFLFMDAEGVSNVCTDKIPNV